MFVCTCMFSFHFISFVTSMKINKLQTVPHPSNSSANSDSPLPPASFPPLPSLPFPSPPFSIPIMLTASEFLTMAVMLEWYKQSCLYCCFCSAKFMVSLFNLSFTKILSFNFLNSHFFQAFEQMKKTSEK